MDYIQKMTQHGFVSASPLPTVEELGKFYSELYYQQPQSKTYQESYPDWDMRHKRHGAAILMKAFEFAAGRPMSGADRYLDIGCGEGFALQAAQDLGMKISGFDFSEFGLKKFHPGLLSCFEAGDAMEILPLLVSRGQSFEFCSMLNVLEHVIDPAALLKSAGTVMAKEGLLAITVPNDFSNLQKKLRELGHLDRDFWFCPPQHLHYFNTENLPLFAAAHGFTLVDMYSGFPIDLFLMHPGSNYIADPEKGPAAHRARVEIDLLLAQSGDGSYLNLCRAMARCGLGRDFTVILKKSA